MFKVFYETRARQILTYHSEHQEEAQAIAAADRLARARRVRAVVSDGPRYIWKSWEAPAADTRRPGRPPGSKNRTTGEQSQSKNLRLPVSAWLWLEDQDGGSSAAVRRLVKLARHHQKIAAERIDAQAADERTETR